MKKIVLVVLWSIGLAVQAQIAAPDAFVRVQQVCPEVIQEIRYASSYNFVGVPIPGYERAEAWLTRQAADSLKAVAEELEQLGYRLKLFDAYRPKQAVQFFVQWAADTTQQQMKPYFYPNCPKSELFRRGYLAHRSGHSRGSTVDVTLFDMRTGKEVDMGGAYDLLDERSHYAFAQITTQQKSARQLLRAVMYRHGFKPVACEWWHFTLRNEPYPETYFDFKIR